tara:strand:+ start:244 stop:411 length:168 start_codon:yes stop_codon:yes gene_type:complete
MVAVVIYTPAPLPRLRAKAQANSAGQEPDKGRGRCNALGTDMRKAKDGTASKAGR